MDYLQQALSDIQFVIPTMGAIISGVLATVLLLFSALASGSEIAFFSLTPNHLNELDEDKNESDRKILKLREDSERTLATILITNNLVNVTIIMLLNYFIAHVVDFGNAVWLEFIVITVLLTFLLLLFGEIMPKVYAGQNPLAFCRLTAGSILFLSKVFYPLSEILIKTGLLAEKVVQKENHVLSVDDLEQALELTDKEELKEEKNMLEGIVRFGDETAKVWKPFSATALVSSYPIPVSAPVIIATFICSVPFRFVLFRVANPLAKARLDVDGRPSLLYTYVQCNSYYACIHNDDEGLS